MEITTQVLLWAFGLAVILGFVATKTNFCTMGAVSDIVNIGDTGRMRAWMFAIGAAILGVLVLGQLGLVDISLTAVMTPQIHHTAHRFLHGPGIYWVGLYSV